jgi:hypothetical protein
LLFAALLPIVCLYAVWLPLTVTGKIVPRCDMEGFPIQVDYKPLLGEVAEVAEAGAAS